MTNSAKAEGGHLVVMAGPTASGKSALALEAARALNAVVINADALQVYADLKILTARPDHGPGDEPPHHLYGHVPGRVRYSVAAWLADATAVIAAAWAKGRPAVVAGGTGLYLEALLEGLSDIPEPPAAVQEEAARDYDRLGPQAFHERLAGVDPVMAARIEAEDRQRACRAWGVFKTSGKAMSTWQSERRRTVLPARTDKAVLAPPRAELYARCDARFLAMMQAGALEEVCTLKARGYDADLPVMKAVGVAHLSAHLDAALDLDEAVRLAQRDTRRLAKRQMTWLRTRAREWPWIDTTLSIQTALQGLVRADDLR